MKIEFLWIKDFGVIKSQGFNFNPNAFYLYNEKTGELTRKISNGLPSDFFSLGNEAISMINALVGANGTGKTSVLEFLAGYLCYHNISGGFLVTDKHVLNKSPLTIRIGQQWDGPPLEVLNRIQITNYPANETEKKYIFRHAYNYILGKIFTDTAVIFYNAELKTQHTNRVYQSLMSLEDEYSTSFFIDISDIAMLKKDQNRFGTDQPIYSGENPILAYRAGESDRIIDFIRGGFNAHIPFRTDQTRLQFKFTDIDEVFFDTYDEMAFKPFAQAIAENLLSIKYSRTRRLVLLAKEVLQKGVSGYFRDKHDTTPVQSNEESLTLKFYHHLLLRHLRERIVQTVGGYEINRKIGKFIFLFKELAEWFMDSKPYLDQIKRFLSLSDPTRATTGNLRLKISESFLQIMMEISGWDNTGLFIGLSQIQRVNTFLNELPRFDKQSGLKYKPSTIMEADLRGFSTGEKQFLKLFSRIASLSLMDTRKKSTVKNIILLLDEFDIGFHPLWQRKYISTLIKVLSSIISQSGKDISIQIVMASHSPFVVSDLPKECITFLRRDETDTYSSIDKLENHHATFGSNIHELLADSFFLKDVLMGDFAKSKIDKAFSELSDMKKPVDHEFISTIIQLVGEPIIKLKLTEMFANRIGEDGTLARLRAQMEYITRRIQEHESNAANQINEE